MNKEEYTHPRRANRRQRKSAERLQDKYDSLVEAGALPAELQAAENAMLRAFEAVESDPLEDYQWDEPDPWEFC